MRVFLILFFVFLVNNVYALTVLEDENKKLDIYGNFLLYTGYGQGEAPAGVDLEAGNNTSDSMLYGVQDNSNVGLRFNIGNFKTHVELGLKEKTLLSQSSDGLGLRYFWGEYDFGKGGALLLGKTDTLTTMSMFYNNYLDNNGMMSGFGGTTTSTRRLQVRYTIHGFSVSVIEDDITEDYINNLSDSYFKDNGKIIPRIAVGYTYNSKNLYGKIAVTAAAGQGEFYNTSSNNGSSKYIAGYGIAAGIKPVFLDNKLWVTVVARFGMNEDLYGEGRTVYNGGIYYNSANIMQPFIDKDSAVYNVYRASSLLEIGYQIHKYFILSAGGGYQYSYTDNPYTEDASSKAYSRYTRADGFAVYLQAQINVNQYLAFLPQVMYTNTQAKNRFTTDYFSSIIASLQMKVMF